MADEAQQISEKKKTDRPGRKPRRWLAARVDASVGSIERHIESTYGLPEGSVRLVLPSLKKARSDKKIGALLRDWGW